VLLLRASTVLGDRGNQLALDSIGSLESQLLEKEAALASASAAGSKEVREYAGKGEGEASFEDKADEKGPVAQQHKFFSMTPQELLHYKATLCGSHWPSQCADLNSASTKATDGWLCSPATGKINDILIYRNVFKGRDEGPEDAQWRKTHPRCISGTCLTTAKDFGNVGIKKISEVGAQLCEWAAKMTREVTVIFDGREEEVGVRARASSSHKAEDISVQLNVPLLAMKFSANGKSLGDKAAAAAMIRAVLAKSGITVTAIAGKICGHGFTNTAPEELQAYPEEFRDLLLARARTVAEVATAEAENPDIRGPEGVAHLVHSDAPCAGLILKLNGAAAEPCAESDWEGAPLQ